MPFGFFLLYFKKLNLKQIFKVDFIHGDLLNQKESLDNLIQIEGNRLKIKIKLLEDEKITNTPS